MSITSLGSGGYVLEVERFGRIQLNTKIETSNGEIIVKLTLTADPIPEIKLDHLIAEIITLPNSASTLKRVLPASRVEMAGKREIINCSTDSGAVWNLCYNHQSERYATWTMVAAFENQYATIVEYNIAIVKKTGLMSKLLATPNAFHWPSVHESLVISPGYMMRCRDEELGDEVIPLELEKTGGFPPYPKPGALAALAPLDPGNEDSWIKFTQTKNEQFC